MADEFAVFSRFRGVLADSTEPLGLVVVKGEKIEIYGLTRGWKNRWARYLERNGLAGHEESASPLASLFSAPYGAPRVFPISPQYQWLLDQTKQQMVGKPIKINLKR